MGKTDKSMSILRNYLKDATAEEAKEVYELLDKREKEKKSVNPGMSGLNINVDKLALNMSKQIQQQMGMADMNIQRMAVDMIVQMARQEQPDISDEVLAGLIEQMIPSMSATPKKSVLPGNILQEMVEQFIAYSLGHISEQDNLRMPTGWVEKYWSNFPEKIQKIITAYLTGIIEDEQFWPAVNYLLEEQDKEEPVTESNLRTKKKTSSKPKRKGQVPSPPGPRRNPY